MSPLDALIEDGIIDLTLKRLKSGKEADVFLVDRGDQVLVAKVYKDKAHRSFKNNADYKEGRKAKNSRTQRAMDSRSKFGREASEEAWKTTEDETLRRLHASGVRVPEPVMYYGGVLLMQLVRGADGCPAPRLIDVEYDPATARAHFLDIRGQMIHMLCLDLIHGDLSPYNILSADAGPTIIDFPQVISAAHNNRASSFFLRDFENVFQFLAQADPALRAHTADGRKIWQAYLRRDLSPDFVPPTQTHSKGRPARRGKSGGSKNTDRRPRAAATPQATGPTGQTQSRPRGGSKPASQGRSPKASETTSESGKGTKGTPRRRRRRRRP